MYVIFFMLCSCNTVAATQMVRFPSGLRDRLCHFFFLSSVTLCASAFF